MCMCPIQCIECDMAWYCIRQERMSKTQPNTTPLKLSYVYFTGLPSTLISLEWNTNLGYMKALMLPNHIELRKNNDDSFLACMSGRWGIFLCRNIRTVFWHACLAGDEFSCAAIFAFFFCELNDTFVVSDEVIYRSLAIAFPHNFVGQSRAFFSELSDIFPVLKHPVFPTIRRYV